MCLTVIVIIIVCPTNYHMVLQALTGLRILYLFLFKQLAVWANVCLCNPAFRLPCFNELIWFYLIRMRYMSVIGSVTSCWLSSVNCCHGWRCSKSSWWVPLLTSSFSTRTSVDVPLSLVCESFCAVYCLRFLLFSFLGVDKSECIYVTYLMLPLCFFILALSLTVRAIFCLWHT